MQNRIVKYCAGKQCNGDGCKQETLCRSVMDDKQRDRSYSGRFRKRKFIFIK